MTANDGHDLPLLARGLHITRDMLVLGLVSAGLGVLSLAARPDVPWLAPEPEPAACELDDEDWLVGLEVANPVPELPSVRPEHVRHEIAGGQVVVVDARSSLSYSAGHIPGAISLPADLAEERLAQESLPIDPSRPVLTYCDDDSSASQVGALLDVQLGCKDVRVLEGGLPAWEAAGGPIEQGEEVLPFFAAEGDANG